MKKIIVLIAAAFMFFQVNAQQETLFNKSKVFGAFGGPIVEFGSVAGEYSPSTGGGGGLIIDDFFIGGYGLASADLNQNWDDDYRFDIAHGGFWLGYNYKSYKLVHPYSSVKIGWGAVDVPVEGSNFNRLDNVFVITPEIGAELNVTKFFHIAATVGYRYVDGVNEANTTFTNSDFNNFNAGLTFRFGWFGNWKKARRNADCD